MSPKAKRNPESVVKKIKRNPSRKFNSKEKIRIILEGLRRKDNIANICRKEGIALSIYHKWSKEFLEAAERQFNGNTIQETSNSNSEVSDLRCENEQLKKWVAELSLKNDFLKKIWVAWNECESLYAEQSGLVDGNYQSGGRISDECEADACGTRH